VESCFDADMEEPKMNPMDISDDFNHVFKSGELCANDQLYIEQPLTA
jgi:hypothetical protein